MSADTVSVEEHLRSFINQIAAEHKFETSDVKISPVSSGGANFTSYLFNTKFTHEGRDDLNLFAKVAALTEDVLDQIFSFQPYDNERLFYSFLMETYRQLEEKNGVSEQDKILLPTYYGAEATPGREILVLEDLTSRGFGPANRFASVDWSYAAAAVTELAKFHALSLAFKHERPKDFETFTANFRRGYFKKTESSDKFIRESILAALPAVREENRKKLRAFFGNHDVLTYYSDQFTPMSCNVILHADFRPSNMLHKVLDDGTTQLIVVDYQTMQAGSPVIDLIFFIFIGADGLFRATYFKKIINHYYSELGVALGRFGLNVEDEYSWKDFEFELREKIPFGLLAAIMVLPAITMPEDLRSEITDVSSVATQPTNELYSQRLNEVIDFCVTSGVL